jgi:hypothetical protein
VTVAASGAVTGLRLDERIRGKAAAAIAAQVLTTIGAAHAEMQRLATQVTAETVGVDSAAGQAVVHSFASRVPPAAEARADDHR